MPQVIANGQKLSSESLPCSLAVFLVEQGFLPKSVVIELNGAAVSPSEFSNHTVKDGDQLEIVRIVAGG
ncbi:MAG: sulfur carrier protein ThiS [Verrucomicrobia bacterium]|jgi:sulfur carrier protein|nr:sulfur carrier protein ThiS [Verrucomicrobiota bacterium]